MKNKIIIFLIILNLGLGIFIVTRKMPLDATYFSIDYYAKIKKPFETNAKILLLGDSTLAFGLRVNDIKDSFMLGLPAASSLVLDLQLKRFYKNVKENSVKCIVLTTTNSNEIHYEKEFWPMLVGNGFIERDELEEIYKEGKSNNLFPMINNGYLENSGKLFLYKYFVLDAWKQFRLKEKIGLIDSQVNWINELRSEVSKENGFLSLFKNERFAKYNKDVISKRLISDYRLKISDYIFKPYLINQSENYYLNKILERTIKEDLNIVYLEMPLNTLDSRAIDFRERHIANISSIFSKNKKFNIIRFHKPYPKEFFKDTTHLNYKGAVFFTNEVKEKIYKNCETTIQVLKKSEKSN